MSASDQTHNEYTEVEKPLIEQLQEQGLWQHLCGMKGLNPVLDHQGRETFRDVLLTQRLKRKLAEINPAPNGGHWLDDTRINQAVRELERLTHSASSELMEKNQAATRLLLEGTVVPGVPGIDQGRNRRIRYIDWDTPANNDFLIINQFRVDEPAGQQKQFMQPDMVLFVNGIPLVVIECKSPASTNPMQEGIDQLLRYSNQRQTVERNEGNEQLFHYVQLMIASSFDEALMACIGAQHEHYLPWKDAHPTTLNTLALTVCREKPSAQHYLVEGTLRPERLLDIVRHFILFMQVDGRTIKIAPRYQQYRAVLKTMQRLETGKTRQQDGEFDRRGGIVFHTQGSGKSLTMVFLIRRMRSHSRLSRFKVVFVTDRTDLQDQLSATAQLSNENINIVEKVRNLTAVLRKPGADVVFAMIQKYRILDEQPTDDDDDDIAELDTLNESADIVLVVDEAHRSHNKRLHANLMSALPNAAKVGFTGTPIIMGKKKRTADIFGEFIDRYTLLEAQNDNAILPILYEFRNEKGAIKDDKTADEIFEEAFSDRSIAEREAIQKKYATSRVMLESVNHITAIARDVMRHYIEVILPNGFKAQLTAVSRLAVMRYYAALPEARTYWLEKIQQAPDHLKQVSSAEIDDLEDDERFLALGWKLRERIAALEFAPIMSGSNNDDPDWANWTDKTKIESRIERFKKPFTHKDPNKADNLAILIVKNMLLVGFDAPIEQVLYIDRKLKEDELLQAIARVNRTRSGKSMGYVVDYVGVGGHLAEVLKAYNKQDLEGAFRSAKQELLDLRDRHARIMGFFRQLKVPDIHDTEACVQALRPEQERAKFILYFKQLLKTYGNLEHRSEARQYASDVKTLGFINARARNRYRDNRLNISGLGDKVRALIDEYLISQGVDPTVPPIDLMDERFKSQVKKQKSNRAAASEMEHAARHHINQKHNEDPEHYEKLSKRLNAILQQFKNDAVALRKALDAFIKSIQEGREEDDTGLDPSTQMPFFARILQRYQERYRAVGDDKKRYLINLTVELVEVISQELQIVGFWEDGSKVSRLRMALIDRMDHPDFSDDLDFIEPLVDELLDIAKSNHAKLTA